MGAGEHQAGIRGDHIGGVVPENGGVVQCFKRILAVDSDQNHGAGATGKCHHILAGGAEWI